MREGGDFGPISLEEAVMAVEAVVMDIIIQRNMSHDLHIYMYEHPFFQSLFELGAALKKNGGDLWRAQCQSRGIAMCD